MVTVITLYQLILFTFYSLLAIYFFKKYKIHQGTGLSAVTVWTLFLLKVFAGVVNLLIHFYRTVSNDVGFYHWQAVNELKQMHKNPALFMYEWLFHWGDWHNSIKLFTPQCNAFWKDIGVQLHTKYMTFANLLTLGNQYVNVVIYNIPFFLGQLLFFKLLYKKFPSNKIILVISVFCIPSVMFWCSGIHKDGWIVAAFGIIFYAFDNWLYTKNRKYFYYFLVGFMLLFTIRYFYGFALLPLLILWYFAFKTNKIKIIYPIAFLFTVIVFFNLHIVIPKANPMQMIQNRQKEFLQLRGYSDMNTPLLENNFISYVKNFPTATNHVLLQPIYYKGAPLKYLIAFSDNLYVLLLIFIFLIYRRKVKTLDPLLITMILYAISIYLFIGYTIPNAGALVRYKSEFTLLLVSAMAAGTSLNDEMILRKIKILFSFK